MGVKPKQKGLSIERGRNGTIELFNDSFWAEIEIRALPPQKKFEAVRTAILEKGLVFTEKIEKKLRRELNL